MIAARRAAGREFFVLRKGGAIGLATYDQFRNGNGYAHATERTIPVSPEPCGRGAGRERRGIAFHARPGFDVAARYPEVGRKFDGWIDPVLMMKRIG